MKNKNKMKIMSLTILSTICIMFFLSSCENNKEIKKPKLVLGTNSDFPPFEYINNKGEIEGFDIDLSRKIAEKSGLELEIQDVPFSSLMLMLETEKVDFVVAGVTVDEEKKKNADFSDVYFQANQTVLVLDSNNEIKTIDDLKGKKIGVQSATTGQETAEGIEDSKVTGYAIITQGVMDLQSGKIDAIIFDLEPSKSILKANENTDVKIKMLDDLGFEVEEYAIAVKKGNEELLKIINETLKELKENGEFEKLVNKYFTE